jgi:hypothetical protein
MKKYVLGIVPFILFASASTSSHECNPITLTHKHLPQECKEVSPCGLKTLFLPRSQGSNMARYLVGSKEYLSFCDNLASGNWSIATEYTQSLYGKRMAHYFFGSTQLHFSGSQVLHRKKEDLLADYFGLGTTFQGSIDLNPHIENLIIDMNYYLSLTSIYPGLYVRFNMPLVFTSWDLGIHDDKKNNGEGIIPFFPAGYMAKTEEAPALNIREALSGNFIFGDMSQPFAFGTFPCGRVQKAAVSQIDSIIGYNWHADEKSHSGIYLYASAPAGNAPQSEIIFEPIVGNGHLWEVGPGISGHTDLIRHGLHIFSFSYNGYIAHQFKKFQRRSFDLIGQGPMSRYMLLKELDDEGRYTGSLFNAIDFSTRAVRVGGSVKVDAAMKFTYNYEYWGVDVGYNLYARTKEKLRLQKDFHPSDLNNRKFGIKGTEGAYYRILNSNTGLVEDLERLNAIQHQARINGSGSVSNPSQILVPPGDVAITWDSPTVKPLKQAFSSSPPLTITHHNLDILSGSVPHQLTHKFFAHLSYTAGNRTWEPQIGMGGEIEVDGRDHLLAALNQWGLWIKVAVSF